MRPLLLDLYCCQGGAAKGYYDVGFDVLGVDIEPQPRYPFEFIQADVFKFLRWWKRLGGRRRAAGFIHASPPCQHDSDTQRIMDNDHADLIGPTRDVLLDLGLPYVIENVEGARPKLRDPVMLCAAMFGRGPTSGAPGLDRHRYFEANWPLMVPKHPPHAWRTTKMGRPPKAGEAMHVVGNFSGVPVARGLMDMPWANRDGLREAIPPYYTRWVGEQFLSQQRLAA